MPGAMISVATTACDRVLACDSRMTPVATSSPHRAISTVFGTRSPSIPSPTRPPSEAMPAMVLAAEPPEHSIAGAIAEYSFPAVGASISVIAP